MAMTLDAGALIAIDRGHRDLFVLLRAAVRRNGVVTVPAPVLGQVWRDGSRQARMASLLAACQIELTTEEMAKAAGVLLGRARRSDVIDALVVLGAARRGDDILTSDPDDLSALVAAQPTAVRITVV